MSLRTIIYHDNSRAIFHRYYGKMMGAGEPDPQEPECGSKGAVRHMLTGHMRRQKGSIIIAGGYPGGSGQGIGNEDCSFSYA